MVKFPFGIHFAMSLDGELLSSLSFSLFPSVYQPKNTPALPSDTF